MADFPKTARFVLVGHQESEEPSVLRTEMERGPAVERVINKDVMMKLSGVVLFLTEEAVEEFDTFYFDQIERIGYFNMRHPRTRQMLRCRLIAGKRGELQAITGGYEIAQRTIEVEYRR